MLKTVLQSLACSSVIATASVPLAAQVVTATAVTGTYVVVAGIASGSVPAGTPVTDSSPQATAATTTGGNVSAFVRSSLVPSEPFRLTTTIGGSSQVTQGLSSPTASGTGVVVATYQAAAQVWGEVVVSWTTSGTSFRPLAAMAMVDVHDDGIAELLLIHLGQPAQAVFPVTFGPGPLRIRTSARLQGIAGNMEQNSTP